jgi:hypothetical protein
MPAPMIAPMPSSTRFTGPSTRLRLWSDATSAWSLDTSFRRNRLMRTSALRVSERRAQDDSRLRDDDG